MIRAYVVLCVTLSLASNICYADKGGPVVVRPKSEEAAEAAEIQHKETAEIPAIPEINFNEVPLPLRIASGTVYNFIRRLPDSPISHTMGFPDTALKPEDLIVDLTGLPNSPKDVPEELLPPLAEKKGIEKAKAIAESKWKELLAVESVAQNETGQKNFLYPREFIAWMEQTMQDFRRLSAINLGVLRLLRKALKGLVGISGTLTAVTGLAEFEKAVQAAVDVLGFPVA
ncbi:unnamed protein product [Acanthoscelides obtectus]|uniref:Uncharacterized protein n=1 Tax=Acanthoscelides obtectus TaxID=200917 RepID=A0A9P0LWL1_ACAOB|nr:unnamed protein product [Acanthoscelides obtectus]CAH2004034.1 unnamed protein product [Acanthoscelides obtectus]CAK1659284.1 hypothetical protein AOBTE_LOCUS21387 [Acanthoscelides obtectus]CAK1659312.1 hypothetical protein AOBTE_LOCUS21403 [Acanthoscelides obtectus]